MRCFRRTRRGISQQTKNVDFFMNLERQKTLVSSERIENFFTGAGRLFFIRNERNGKKFVFFDVCFGPVRR